MKIAQINPGHMTIPPDSWGAVEKIIWYYKLESEKKGHEVHIRYINEVQCGEFDVVHVHMWNHALELYDKGIPYIFTCHDHHAYVNGKNSNVYRNNLLAMKRAKLAIVPAPYLIDYFEGVPIYLRHGIDLDDFYIGEPNQSPKLLIVGNNGMNGDPTFDRKGFRYAIEAAEKLKLPITVVGPSDCNEQFFAHHSDLIKDNVVLLYDLSEEELKKTYRSHDILIHATSIEAGHPPLTLLEAAASGLPLITTACGGDLHTTRVTRNTEEVVSAIQNVLRMYPLNRSKTINSVKHFSWQLVVDDLSKLYETTLMEKTMKSSALEIYRKIERRDDSNHIIVNFMAGVHVEILGQYDEEYDIQFIDQHTNEIVYRTKLRNNHWAKCGRKWVTNWKVLVTNLSTGSTREYLFDTEGKRVLISFESSSLGDTLAWIPYVEKFAEQNKCKVIVSTFMNELFSRQYPNIEFVNPGETVHDLYAIYRLGVFYGDSGCDFTRHKTDFRKLSLQQIATDILGLDYEEIRPRIKHIEPISSDKPYICIANHSTAQSKYWNNPTGWQELVDYVKSLGYDVYLLSREEDGYMGNKNPKGVIKVDGKSLEEIGSILLGSQGFIGLSSGLSWLSWALNVPTILISGVTETTLEPTSNIHRIINEEVCHGCFARHLFDKGDWNWCPDHKGTDRQFECTKSITFQMVKPKIDKMLNL